MLADVVSAFPLAGNGRHVTDFQAYAYEKEMREKQPQQKRSV
jgi:hypothetical protein